VLLDYRATPHVAVIRDRSQGPEGRGRASGMARDRGPGWDWGAGPEVQ